MQKKHIAEKNSKYLQDMKSTSYKTKKKNLELLKTWVIKNGSTFTI